MTTKVDLPSKIRGDTWTLKIQVQNLDESPRDITGWTFWFTLKLNPTVADEDADAQVELLVEAGDDATAGICYLTLLPAVTETLLPASHYYDVQYKSPLGDVQTMMYGKQPISRDITRSR